MATESSIFYDPFANRADKFDALDRLDSVSKFDSKFTKEKESKRDVAGSDSNNGDDSPNEVDFISHWENERYEKNKCQSYRPDSYL